MQEQSKLPILVSNVMKKELVPSVIIQVVFVHVMVILINQQRLTVRILVVLVQEQDVRIMVEDLIS